MPTRRLIIALGFLVYRGDNYSDAEGGDPGSAELALAPTALDGGVMERNPGWGTILGRPFEMRARQVQHSSGPAKSLETCAVTENQWAPPMSGEQR